MKNRNTILIILLSWSISVYAHQAKNTLGWTPATDQICEGYFVEPNLNPKHKPVHSIQDSETIVQFDRSRLHAHHTSELSGNVIINQTGRRIHADRVTLIPLKNETKPHYANLFGHVHIWQKGKLFTGSKGHLLFREHKGYLIDSDYRFLLDEGELIPYKQNYLRSKGLTAWGRAKKIEQLKRKHFYFTDASFSTCSPTNTTWTLHASTLDLNQDTGRGVAHHSILRVHNIPIFYFPYIDFPIDGRRKTGFLSPAIGSSSHTGLDIQTPYYINLAPQYDLTLAPRFMQQRGILLNAHARYLSANSQGQFVLSYIPSDREFARFRNTAAGNTFVNNPYLSRLLRASNNRGSIYWQNKTKINDNLALAINYNWVSDDYLLHDLSYSNYTPLVYASATNQLPQNITLFYHDPYSSGSFGYYNFQTLQPINQAAAVIAYNRLPDFKWQSAYSFQNNLRATIDIKYVQFRQSAMQPGAIRTPITGNRLHLAPMLSYDWHRNEGYIRPSIKYHVTKYNLFNQLPGRASQVTRAIPIINIDSGLFFEKNFKIFKYHYLQTLEPRLKYTYIPFRNQFDIPIFDSTIFTYKYSNLFSENRFMGLDRIGDTNQVAIGATSRLLNDYNGSEKLHVSLGEIFFYGNRRVKTCFTTGCQETSRSTVTGVNRLKASIIAAETGYYFNRQNYVSAGSSWDPQAHQFNSTTFHYTHRGKKERIFDVLYSFTRNGMYQYQPLIAQNSTTNTQSIRVSLTWPVLKRWRLLATAQRNLSLNYLQDYLLGVEYNTCCWAARIVTGKVYSSLNARLQPQYDRNIYIQWQLKGLGAIGNKDPSDILKKHIPGYTGWDK